MALVADGCHMATHAGALAIAALAYRYARNHVHFVSGRPSSASSPDIQERSIDAANNDLMKGFAVRLGMHRESDPNDLTQVIHRADLKKFDRAAF